MSAVVSINHSSKLAQIATGSRTCQGCGLNKPLAEFGQHPHSRDGFHKICSPCRGDRIAAGRRRGRTERTANEQTKTDRRREQLASTLHGVRQSAAQARGMAMLSPGLSVFADTLAEHSRALDLFLGSDCDRRRA